MFTKEQMENLINGSYKKSEKVSDFAENSKLTKDHLYSGITAYHGAGNGNLVGYNAIISPGNTAVEQKTVGVEMEMYCNTRESFDELCNTPKNWFWTSHDGSLDDCRYGVECITVPLTIEALYSCLLSSKDWFKDHAKSDAYETTGLHCHVGIHNANNAVDPRQPTAKYKSRLASVFFAFKNGLLNKFDDFYGRSNEHYCQPLYERCCTFASLNACQDMWMYFTHWVNDVGFGVVSRMDSHFYELTSCRRSAGFYTNEFRLGKGTVDAEKILRLADAARLITCFAETNLPVNGKTLREFVMEHAYPYLYRYLDDKKKCKA